MYERMNETLAKLVERERGIYLIDDYNKAVYTDIACATTTRVSSSNHIWVVELGYQANILKGENMVKKLTIRKLTEGECYRLMGFEEKDTEACKAVGQSKANIYHQAGDSIVTTVLCGIFGTLLGLDYEKAIENHSDKLHDECV